MMAMTLLFAAFLGLVQGLTEFFPISSSAHLKLVRMALGLSDVPPIFDLACHLGTLGALIWFFKEDIVELCRNQQKKLLYFFLALIPLVPFYFLLGSFRKMVSEPQFLGFFLMVTGVILLIGKRVRLRVKSHLVRDVLLIGTMQSAAPIPGISRSASTISCAQVLGWNSREAVRFSFLLAIPTIMGGNLLEAYALSRQGEIKQLLNLSSFVGFITAFAVGIFVIRLAVRWLEKGNLTVFAWYCILLGITTTLCMFYR